MIYSCYCYLHNPLLWEDTPTITEQRKKIKIRRFKKLVQGYLAMEFYSNQVCLIQNPKLFTGLFVSLYG